MIKPREERAGQEMRRENKKTVQKKGHDERRGNEERKQEEERK